MTQPDYKQMAREAAKRHGLAPELFLGLVQQESAWKPSAESRAGAKGLSQLMSGTARDLGLTVNDKQDDRLDPAKNLDAGARYLKQQIDRFGSEKAALLAYNWGPRNADRYLKGEIKSMPKEAQDYPGKVIGHSTRFGRLDRQGTEVAQAPAVQSFAAPPAAAAGAPKPSQTQPQPQPQPQPQQRAALPYTAADGTQGVLMAGNDEENNLMTDIADKNHTPEHERQLTRAIAQLLPARDMLAGQNVMGGSAFPTDLDHLFNDIIEAA